MIVFRDSNILLLVIKYHRTSKSESLSIYGHGYLLEPVARSSAWLVDASFRQCCTWPQHMEMFCGGLGHQWNVNGGKCSICGEAYDKPVKDFEKGGARYKGTIVRTYTQGQQIDVQVVLTANHKGYFEFRLCNLDASPSADASQECLDRHLLKIANTDSTKFRDVDKYGSEMIALRVQLPPNVACQHCVFQWKYTAGNSWGTDPTTGQSGPGLGKENETFMGCSDIAILSNGSPIDPPMVIIPTVYAYRFFRLLSDEVMYDGIKFRCIAPHRSYPGAEPGLLTWAWWERIEDEAEVTVAS
ncbi:hypothetical protein I4U23_001524 [Adineta vaga]|nr:hypothetical protein I4U23_001524 [Adineta vaga]